MKIKEVIGTVSFFIGMFGVPGAIENDGNLVLPIVLFLIGLALIRGNDEKKVNDFTSDNSFRPKFLP